MAIQIYCPGCKTCAPTASKKCPKCGATFPREGRRYRVDVSVKGKRVTRFCDNLTIAREVEASIKGDLVRGEFDIKTHKVRKEITLADVWDKYLPWAKANKKTWDDDQYHYHKHLEGRFASKPLESITPFEIEKLKLDLKRGTNQHGKPYAAATIKHQIVLLRRLFNVARKWGLYEGGNPVEKVQMPKVDNEKTEFLTEEELDRLLQTLDAWPVKESAAFVRFALFTGLRRGELFKLKWDDVDFERGMITLRNPKGGKTTSLPLSPQALDVLRSLDVSSAFVFPGENGEQRVDFKLPWLRIRKAAGLPADFRFHGLRHHFASTLVSNGVDLSVVRELLTHKSIATTQRYAHLAPDVVKDAAAKAGELLSGKKKTVTPLPVKGR